MLIWTGTKEIKTHVENWILQNANFLNNKKVLDFPAGNGFTSELLKKVNAQVTPMDLFPELFRVNGLQCLEGDLNEVTPLPASSFDCIICQEGIEHVPNQPHAFKELSRLLKTDGTLLLTTPNYSNLKSRLSYLFNESEYFGKIMPANEIDSIWFSPEQKKIYFGHIFLISITKLRLLALLSGLRIKRLVPAKVNTTSLLAFPFLFPFVWFFSKLSLQRAHRKLTNKSDYRALKEVMQLAVSPYALLANHLIIEFEKNQVDQNRQGIHEDSNFVT